jgi:hypothetical protein
MWTQTGTTLAPGRFLTVAASREPVYRACVRAKGRRQVEVSVAETR